MTRAQAYTLEGVIGGILLIAAVLYGLQAVDTAPYTGGTNERSTELLHQELQDAMTLIREADGFRRTVSCIEPDGGPDPRVARVRNTNMTTPGAVLGRTFSDVGYSYSIEFRYWENTTSSPTGDGRQNASVVYDSGSSGSDAVATTQHVALYNDTTIRVWDEDIETCRPAGNTVETNSSFYAPYVGDGTELYNVVDVYVVVWRGG